MSVNYDRVCRLCLSSRGELLPIFPTTSPDDSEPPILASKIKDCVSVQISANDVLPTNVCRKCMDNVNNWHIFKSVCERAQNKLESLIKKDGNQLEEVQVKSEPLSDEAYDDGVVIDGSYRDSENVANAAKVQPEGPPILASLGLTPRSDKKYVDPRMDWHRVHAILDMVQDDEVIDSLQCTEESNVLHVSDHDSDSETDLQPLADDSFIDCRSGYILKNKKLISKNPKFSVSPSMTKLEKIRNLKKRKIEQLDYCPQPKNAWQKFFSDDLLELIVSSTNYNIQKNDQDSANCTTADEIKAMIGILYMHGILRPTHQKCSDLWNSDFGVPCVRNAMKYERFKFLLQNLCFDKDDDNIMQCDVMKRMRKVFEIFAMNCRTAFDVANTAVIDEIVIPIYGPCPFSYDIRKKPLKSGIKMVLVVDPSTFYISNLDVITDPYFGAEDIVKKLVQHLAGTGKTIVMDSWYSSTNLINHLLKEYQLLTLAGVNPTDDIIPPLFVSTYRECGSCLTGFLNDDITLTSYVTSESKAVNVVTNDRKYHKKSFVRHTTAVFAYKKNQSAVEVLDVLMHYYTTMQNTNNWTHSLFFTLLNIAALNAQVVWIVQNSSTFVKRRSFINQLAISLLDHHAPLLPSVDVIKNKNQIFISEHSKATYKNRRRCRICCKTTKQDRRTKQFCYKCGQFICREHTVFICTVCGGA